MRRIGCGTAIASPTAMPLLLLLVACSPVRLTDTTRLAPDLFGADPDHLATPYVVGASFQILLSTPKDPGGWTLEATDPDVLAVGEGEINRDEDGDGTVTFPVTAVGVGSVELLVRDRDGEEALRADARVAAPTRVELRSASDLELDPTAAALAVPKVLVGGTAAFRVDFFEGDTPLAGAGGLVATAGSGLVLEDKRTFPTDSDWLVVTPSEAGTLTLALATGGADAGSVSLEAVDSSSIAGITLDRDDEALAEDGEGLQVLATLEDDDGATIYGAVFTWTAGGEPLDAPGDVFTYTFDASEATVVEVASGDLSETVTVHGRGGGVSDTSNVACAVANVGPVGVAVLLAAMGAVRRRRAAKA
jgi:hypothetical protein